MAGLSCDRKGEGLGAKERGGWSQLPELDLIYRLAVLAIKFGFETACGYHGFEALHIYYRYHDHISTPSCPTRIICQARTT